MKLSDALTYSQGLNQSESEFLLQNYTKERKSQAVAYVLLLLLGCFGAHKFYMGNIFAGVIYAVLGVLFVWIFCLPTLLLSLIDLFFLGFQVYSFNK